jgi:BirA family biotin operon repressor/biotin-[acetyl-CoA-carboxylase] ligase
VPFSPEAFFLGLRSEQFGRELRLLEEAPSTLDFAWDWLRADGPQGGVVIAARQTAGRGRAGRTWSSPEGGLWMSVLARPGIPAAHVGRLSVALALATAEAVRVAAGLEVGVKWPNDVVWEGKKLAGVLGETEHARGVIARAVLSVGVNANLRLADLPAEIRATATTLREMTGQDHALELLAARLLEALEARWPSVLSDGVALRAEWAERDALREREVTVEMGQQTVRGVARGIDGEGALRLLVEGEERRLTAGEIVQVRVSA